jgi:hypothetical protein
LVPAGHSQDRKQIENLVFVDEMNALGVQTHKMRAIFAVFITHARVDAEQVCIRTVGTFAERDAELWNSKMTGVADSEEIFTGYIMSAALRIAIRVYVSENSTSHE